MSTIEHINYTVRDETHGPSCLRRLAARGAAGFFPALPAAAARRGAPALAGTVSRAASDRAGPADPDGPARRDACVRRLERDRARGPARISRAGAPQSVHRGPPGESPRAHLERVPPPNPPARPHDGAAPQ